MPPADGSASRSGGGSRAEVDAGFGREAEEEGLEHLEERGDEEAEDGVLDKGDGGA